MAEAPIARGEILIDPDWTYVYLVYDSSETLLYVGMTNNLGRRLGAHVSESSWYLSAARVVWETYPTRTLAGRVEAGYIRELRPRFNVVFQDPQPESERTVVYPVAAWRTLGHVIAGRRRSLRRSQRLVAADAGVPVALFRDMEHGAPAHYTPAPILAIERALRWRPGSIEAVLRGGEPIEMSATERQDAVMVAYDEVMA